MTAGDFVAVDMPEQGRWSCGPLIGRATNDRSAPLAAMMFSVNFDGILKSNSGLAQHFLGKVQANLDV